MKIGVLSGKDPSRTAATPRHANSEKADFDTSVFGECLQEAASAMGRQESSRESREERGVNGGKRGATGT